jgi:hypothetical protein
MTYAILIYRMSGTPLPPEAERAALTGHQKVQAEAHARGELHAVARLDDPTRARVVRGRAGAHQITDGPYIETKEWLVGFYLIDCENEEEALRRAGMICVDGAHAIEVRPVGWRWRP